MIRVLFASLLLLLAPVAASAQTLLLSPNSLPLSGSCGTATVNAPCVDLTQTWNNSGITFYGFRLNVTDTASASASLLMDLQVAGSTKFNVDKSGNATAAQNLSLGNGWSLVSPTKGRIGFFGSAAFSLSDDPATKTAVLAVDAANTLALRNGVSAQAFNIYSTYTDTSNYQGLRFDTSTANVARITTQRLGTGSNMALQLGVNSTDIVQIATTGHLLWNADNTYDIGASGATRPRNVYVASSVVAGGNIAGGALLSNATTFASLQTCNSGAKGLREFITDGSLAASGNFAAAAAGGGANNVPVYCDGTNWKIG